MFNYQSTSQELHGWHPRTLNGYYWKSNTISSLDAEDAERATDKSPSGSPTRYLVTTPAFWLICSEPRPLSLFSNLLSGPSVLVHGQDPGSDNSMKARSQPSANPLQPKIHEMSPRTGAAMLSHLDHYSARVFLVVREFE
jgi:hypothetical protein